MKIEALARLERNAKRLGEIVGVMAKYGLADWLKGLHYSWIQDRLTSYEGQPIAGLGLGARLRMAFTELGTSFIKLGQILSTRSDLVGPELADELSRLQSQTPSDAFDLVRSLIREELGADPESLFASIEPVAMASASIAQVHRATLPTGEDVVVKVQHHDIEQKIQSDLEILAALAELAEKHSPQLRPYQPVATVRQFRTTLLRELNFSNERRNLEQFARNFAHDRTVRFPQPYPAFSSSRILTMERLDGISGTSREALASSGVDLHEFSQRGATIFLEMIFRDSFYHADPHPGNLMLLPGGVIGIIDCGMAGRLDENLRDQVESLLISIAEKDSTRLTEVVLRLGSAPPDCPRDQLRTDIDDFLAMFVGQSLQELELSAALNSLTEIIRRYHIVLPAPLSLLLRMLVVLEGTSRQLHPDFSLAEIIRPFYVKIVGRRFAPKRLFNRIQRSARDWDHLADVLPRDLSDILTRLRNGTFHVHLDHHHLDAVANRLVIGIITASLFLGSSLLWSMKAPPVVGGVSVFGAAGYLLAVHLGWRLFRSIKRSQK